MAFLKLSILALYDAMFRSRNFRRCLLAISSYTIVWAIASIVVNNLRCIPLASLWDPGIHGGWCLAYTPFVVVMTGLDVVGGFAVLAIPVPMVLRLGLNKRKQRIVVLAFSLGAA
jgi:hypothetical protein